ncbi:MAG TPA: prephenate dehydratase [Pirellulales bacterium]|jgi:chorismate mutase/prephenate dehydratase|nr:prephenate dehydratase [Pirellulales bacterium]
MAREKPSKKPAGAASSRTPTITSLRSKIDRVDQELVRLINDRAKFALEIGKLKNSSGISAYAPAREDEVLSRVLALSKGPLADRCVRAVFREVISGSRALEKELRVAFLGPAYSYSHLAALHRFGQSVELVPVSTIAAVFEEINRHHADFGLVPIENSTDGRVADTLDMFARMPARICGEVQLRIHHNLLGKCPRGEVEEVYSKPQALSQCRNWLAKHLPGARTIEVTSTTTAAQLAQDKLGAAAIASLQAGVHYGLDVLAADIEDNKANITRFAVIGDETGPRSGNDKCALMFEIPHRAGALADAMNVFKRNRLNLTWIESFPIARPEGGYMFFVALEGHEDDTRVRKAIAALEKKAVRLDVLGSYANMAPVE